MSPLPRRRARPRWGHASGLFLVALLLVSCRVQGAGAQGEPPALAPPPAGTLYHGVYPGGTSGEEHTVDPTRLDAYERAVGAEAGWVTFSHEWSESPEFPTETVRWIVRQGAVPYVRLMLRSSTELERREETYTLARIAGGAFDEGLRRWGAAARRFGAPLLVEWGTEANGRWFPWNGVWNGGAEAGPRAFRETYRHIVETVAAPNVVWVFHVNAYDDPAEPWNALENYYPGDDVVDWLGVSVYGSQLPGVRPRPFAAAMDEVVPRLRELAPDKPIFVVEFGTALNGSPGRQARWAGEALDALLAGAWPGVRGFAWWNESWPLEGGGRTTMRVQDNPQLAEAFRSRLSGSEALASPRPAGERPAALRP